MEGALEIMLPDPLIFLTATWDTEIETDLS